jgi:hypothetical protein
VDLDTGFGCGQVYILIFLCPLLSAEPQTTNWLYLFNPQLPVYTYYLQHGVLQRLKEINICERPSAELGR